MPRWIQMNQIAIESIYGRDVVVREISGQPARCPPSGRRRKDAVNREAPGDHDKYNPPQCPIITNKHNNSVIGEIRSDIGCREDFKRRDLLRIGGQLAVHRDLRSIRDGMTEAVATKYAGAVTLGKQTGTCKDRQQHYST
jgi:hypothetical protein